MWIFRGEILGPGKEKELAAKAEAARGEPYAEKRPSGDKAKKGDKRRRRRRTKREE